MDNTPNLYEDKIRRKDKWAIIALIIGLLALISPLLFTMQTPFESWDFTTTGQIGDTIGGITAPFLSLVGSVLVFLSFRAQIEMNRVQFTAIQNQFNKMKDDKKQEQYDRMQHVVNIINDRYLDQFTKVFSGGYIETELEEAFVAFNHGNTDFMEIGISEAYSNVLQLGALIHLKDIVEYDQNHNPDINQLNFVKIQIGMILEKIGFKESFPRIFGYFERFERGQLKKRDSFQNETLLNIQMYLKNILALEILCADNGIPTVSELK